MIERTVHRFGHSRKLPRDCLRSDSVKEAGIAEDGGKAVARRSSIVGRLSVEIPLFTGLWPVVP
jgi:hypothetical protein